MGDIIRVQCDACEIDREEHVGFGMRGLGQELCACNRCRRLVLKRMDARKAGETGPDGEEIFRCPYCRRLVESIGEECPCPVCGGRLTSTWCGTWD